MSGYGQTTVAIDALRPTEAADPQVIAALVDDIRSAGELRQPILVEADSLAILDGHHRYHAARALGLKRLPAILISYADPRLSLCSWSERTWSREEVIEAAMRGKILPMKSTRHRLDPEPQTTPTALHTLR